LTDDMLRADPRLRRQTLIALGFAAILALVALVVFKHWLDAIGALPGTDILIYRLRRMIGMAMTGSAVCLALLAWYAAHKASKARLVEQWPLPGTRVMRDTPIRRGEAARSIALLLNITAVVLLVLAFATGYFSWQMLN
jgi:hypothetical protein